MRKFEVLCAILCLAALAFVGCSGSKMTVVPVTASSSVTVLVTDTPPAGVSILSFEVSLTGATLNPGNADLLGSRAPVRIEVKQLETEAAFLSTANVPPGMYTTLNLTFANVELTFQNNTGSVLAGCAVGAICEINPSGTLTSSVTLPNSGINLSANTSTGLLIDVNPNAILTSALGVDFSQPGAASVQQLQDMQQGQLDDLDDLVGSVQNLNSANQTFTLHTANGDFSVLVNGTTQFDFNGGDDNNNNCPANNFSCLQNNQVISADLFVMSGGAFVAKKIEFEDEQEDNNEVEGIVSKIDDATHFEIVVLNELQNVTNVSVGNPVVVTLNNNSQFQVDQDGLNVPSTLQNNFEHATDTSQLIPGQDVQLKLSGSASAGPPITVTATQIRLRTTQFTATVSGAPVPPNFNVGNLPALFTAVGISSIQVQTSNNTNFGGGISDLSGLTDGATVSLRGLLFSTGSTPPTLIAAKVLKR